MADFGDVDDIVVRTANIRHSSILAETAGEYGMLAVLVVNTSAR